jgi:hypothetical protein
VMFRQSSRAINRIGGNICLVRLKWNEVDLIHNQPVKDLILPNSIPLNADEVGNNRTLPYDSHSGEQLSSGGSDCPNKSIFFFANQINRVSMKQQHCLKYRRFLSPARMDGLVATSLQIKQKWLPRRHHDLYTILYNKRLFP